MQAWGTSARFDYRWTDREPSKSGVLGLISAALGCQRAEPIDDLAGLRMGVRVDREGTLSVDYQTALDVLKADRTPGETVQSRRYYLADAVFLVGLARADDNAVLAEIHAALRNPRWTLFLGRKGYLPSAPIYLPDGLRDLPLEEALARYRPLTDPAPDMYRYILEAREGSLRMDQPGGPFSERRFRARYVRSVMVPRGEVPSVPE